MLQLCNADATPDAITTCCMKQYLDAVVTCCTGELAMLMQHLDFLIFLFLM